MGLGLFCGRVWILVDVYHTSKCLENVWGLTARKYHSTAMTHNSISKRFRTFIRATEMEKGHTQLLFIVQSTTILTRLELSWDYKRNQSQWYGELERWFSAFFSGRLSKQQQHSSAAINKVFIIKEQSIESVRRHNLNQIEFIYFLCSLLETLDFVRDLYLGKTRVKWFLLSLYIALIIASLSRLISL